MNAQALPFATSPAATPLTGFSPSTGVLPPFTPIATTDPVFALIATHKQAYETAFNNGIGIEGTEAEHAAENAALEAVRDAAPSTAEGLKAWVEYLAMVVTRDDDTELAAGAMPQMAEAVERLVSLSATSPQPAHDPIPALYAERNRVVSMIHDHLYRDEAEADALMDAWGACDRAAIATPAATPAGALASLEWARAEYLQFTLDDGQKEPDQGERLVLALLDGAIDVLRAQSTSDLLAPNTAEVPVTAPQPTTDLRALEAYATWLNNEREGVMRAIYGGHPPRELLHTVYTDTAAADFHQIPGMQAGSDPTSPAARAVETLDRLGIDWRSDPVLPGCGDGQQEEAA